MLRFVRHLLIALFSSFFITTVCSQQTEYRTTHYDETTGLESNVINAMLQDSRGYLWFGTADGLCRYDGYNFKTFRKISGENNSLPGNFVLKLTEDRDGKIWIGLLKDGISCYDPATGVFRNYNVKNIDPTTPLARSVTMLFTDKANNIWAGLAQKGLLKLNRASGKFSQYNIIADTSTFYSKEFRGAYNNVYGMYEEGKNIYWLATHDGLYKFNDSTAQMMPVRAKPLFKSTRGDDMSKTIREDLFITLVADKNGLWMGSWAGGLSHYNLTTKQWSNYKFSAVNKNIATNNIISDIKRKSENELWISSLDRGFGIFNKTTLQFTFFGDSNGKNPGIPSSACSNIMLDK